MPTIRKRHARYAALRVTPAAVESYRTMKALEPTYDKHHDKVRCLPGSQPYQRCDDCAAYMEARSALSLELRAKPWEPHPADPDSEFFAELERLAKEKESD